MWRRFGLLAFFLGASQCAIAAADNSNGWHMSPVRVIQARVQGDAPVWNAEAKMWLSKYGDTTELTYMNNLDTVNTASVEGALMYVQAEGINVNEQSVKCHRKNDMQYVVFYEMTIVQPTYGIKYYESHTPPEYGDFVAMDGAKCTNAGSDLPQSCKIYNGLDGEKRIGPMVGCNPQGSDPRAPYPGNYWFSYPNSCVQKYRAEKTDQCRAEFPGGLCALGVQPDGDNCTFSYKILGYLNIDDLVGITNMGFSNYQQFCESGGVEFKATNTGNGFEVEQCIDFWKNPGDSSANANRATQMVATYNQLATNGTSANMEPLPSVEALTAGNPKCYQNSASCAHAQFGCSRGQYSQICSVCSAAADGCVTAPADFSFPELSAP
ncbi:Bifunctional arginine demethylase and lysyl-hydroxylase PSR [Phytophthora cinnamomi]|uniref:Bifunctional arginine demethylase and lysyl-hydroxylase PSR n=1 Tax=Phytophthora cinnamomi TaxID=4785 RepID=UPI003559B658|nr:Bifunctional arginine demethylase and lysyl-hydroxylase PSR [Phytophthora cinnamomi]